MHPFRKIRRLLLGSLAASILGFGGTRAGAQPAQPAPQPAAAAQPDAKLGKSGELLVPLGGVVRFVPKPTGWNDVLTEGQDIVSAIPDPANANAILLSGRSPGITRIRVTYPDGKATSYEVVVQADFDLLRRVIQRAVPTANVDVIPGVGRAVILTGFVNKPEDADVILRIAQAAVQGTGGAGGGGGGAGGGGPGGQTGVINAIQVGGVQHVQIEVVIAQVDRSELRSRGFDFLVQGTSVQFSSTISGLINATQFGAGATTPTINPSANLVMGITPAGLLTALKALRTENLAKFLSEPKIVTQSGRPAVLRSGGQQATLGATAGGLGSISVTLQQIGTTLEVLPIVYGNGKIYLEVNPTVRSVNQGQGITTTAGVSPGFNEQSTQASVVLESGQTFAIGGLLETTVNATSNKVPVLGDLPFVGPAFSTVQHQETERELLIMVTPRLVDPMDCTQVPKRVSPRDTRSPDDYELFLEGLLEAPRGQRQVWNGRCYNAAWKCDTTGLFPCKGNVCTGGAGAAGGCSTGGCPVGAVPGKTAFQQVPPPVFQIAPTADAVAPVEAVTPAAPPAELPVPPASAGGR
jgi:pilus assembly protein CpaC